ncbi:MAG: hypothetical protein Q9165_001719 [Trypethelium subeluteriae]
MASFLAHISAEGPRAQQRTLAEGSQISAAASRLLKQDPLIRQRQLKKLRATDTGQWFLESPKFQNWVANDMQTLFCPGVPGSGKSITISMVIDMLFDTFGDNVDVGIAIFYCSYDQDQKPAELLGSLLKQLGERMPSLPTVLVDLYDYHTTSPSNGELFKGIASTLASLSKAYIVIDALDELSSSTRGAFLSDVLALQREFNVNLFATSRSFSDIIGKFEGLPTLEISVRVSDLIRFVDQRGLQLIQTNPRLKDEIKRLISVKASHGMNVISFSLACLQLTELLMQRTLEGVRAAFESESTSRKFNDFWESGFERIEVLPEEQREIAKTVLAWLTFAKRSLKVAELQHAIEVKNGAIRFDEANASNIGDIVAMCQGFVTYVKTDDLFNLADVSAYDFLQANQHEWGPDVQETIATCCITCLTSDGFSAEFCRSDEEFESRLKSFPLCRYAAQYWGAHLDEKILSLLEPKVCTFLMDQAKVACVSQTMLASGGEQLQPGYSQKVTRQMTGLHLAASFGLTPMIKLLLAKGQKPVAKDSEGRTPLWCATENRHGDTMRLLSNADRTTFTTMVAKGKKPLARTLLQEAGPHVRGLRSRTALHIGVLHNDLDIMGWALSNGVNINSKDGDGSTPIQLAFRERKMRAVDFLLKDAADADFTDITVDDWLQVYDFDDSHVVELFKGEAGHKMVRFITLSQFRAAIASYSEPRSRLL